ncbi:ribosomal RNA small subunit methyltransferase, chloroplastic isoform X2 [Cryptomeria japonica]|uniref:ribosomal RNA small subunit methyltransferase, chloroplastic isoform X2 n=1 Tax=Cryptomeria japonica TaxID=3369 RepID=UPI0025AB79C8|nr:ribosomal RNA small subunit methyltransferase, chloroplastic isoform X2 [Cryptomeria japonica]
MNSASLCHRPSWKITALKWKSKNKSMNMLNIRCNARVNGEDDYHSTLKALQSRGRFPRKSLGQHYMLNSEINEFLVKEAQVNDGDVVLEIGPGTGSLTNVLVNAGALVFAIEKDPHMAALVSERFRDNGKVKVVQDDFTRCHIKSQIESFSASVREGSDPGRLAKVISNLPFNITTEVLKILLPMGEVFSHVVLLLQEETALRLVDAAIVAFQLKRVQEYPPIVSPERFFSMVNSAFNGKRKMLRQSLQHLHASHDIQLALKTLGLPETSRPEELKLDDFVGLYNLLENPKFVG